MEPDVAAVGVAGAIPGRPAVEDAGSLPLRIDSNFLLHDFPEEQSGAPLASDLPCAFRPVRPFALRGSLLVGLPGSAADRTECRLRAGFFGVSPKAHPCWPLARVRVVIRTAQHSPAAAVSSSPRAKGNS